MEGEESYDRGPRGSDLHVRRDLTLAETGKFSSGDNSAPRPSEMSVCGDVYVCLCLFAFFLCTRSDFRLVAYVIYAGILDAYMCLYTLKACVCHFFNAVCTSSPALREATVMNTAPGAPTTARCVMLVVDIYFFLLRSNWKFSRFCGLSQRLFIFSIEILFEFLLNAFSKTAF